MASRAPEGAAAGAGGFNRVKISKELSYLLRHGAEKVGLPIDSAGYVPLSDILARKDFRNTTEANIREIVASCEKQRFAIRDGEDGKVYIRANQGHSMKDVIDEGALLTPISDAHEYPVVVHGTYLEAWELIKASGLSRMARTHIHFAVGLPGESGVISGMRKSAEVLVFVDLARALADGIPFFVSANKVVLSPGAGSTGAIPAKYFQRVVHRETGRVLFPSGDGGASSHASPSSEAAEQVRSS